MSKKQPFYKTGPAYSYKPGAIIAFEQGRVGRFFR